MKTKIVLTLSFLSLITSVLKAQIGNEIKSYVDSTELYVNNGKKLLIKSLQNGNKEKALDIYYYLQTITIDKDCEPFTFNEELFILCLTSEYEKWLQQARQYRHDIKALCYPDAFDIHQRLFQQIADNSDKIEQEIEKAGLDPEGTELLTIFIHYIAVGQVNKRYAEEFKAFQERYKDSDYDNFLKNYMPDVPLKASMSYSAGASYVQTTGYLKEYFSPNAVVNLSLDAEIRKVFVSLYLHGGGMQLNKPFVAYNGNNTMNFESGESFSYVDAGLMTGIFVIRNDRFHLAPLLTLGGSNIQSNRFDSSSEGEEVKVYNSFICGPGIHTELKITEFETKNRYGYGYPFYYGNTRIKSYLSLKLEAGYNFITSHKNKIFKGNTAFIGLSLAYGIGDF
ncbi:MAG TPA: hypothetical protein VE870_12770 [Bacteroidales bacterium]|nr:hypothetical protein [Bacteroidales bacterium]